MADEVDNVGKVLDQIDSLRRRAQIAAFAGMVAALGVMGRLGYLIRTTDDMKLLLRTEVQANFVITLAAAFMVMFWMSHMTQRVLRAIQLAAERARPKDV
jgi:hypothetical protein